MMRFLGYALPSAFLAFIVWIFGYGCARERQVDAYIAECGRRGGYVVDHRFVRYCVARMDTIYAGPRP